MCKVHARIDLDINLIMKSTDAVSFQSNCDPVSFGNEFVSAWLIIGNDHPLCILIQSEDVGKISRCSSKSYYRNGNLMQKAGALQKKSLRSISCRIKSSFLLGKPFFTDEFPIWSRLNRMSNWIFSLLKCVFFGEGSGRQDLFILDNASSIGGFPLAQGETT